MRSSFSMSLLYHAYVYLEFLILACTIYILAPNRELRRDCYEKGIGIIWGINLHVVIRRL